MTRARAHKHKHAPTHTGITGRTDDVINISGHRLGTAEVETAIMHAPGVAKAAVVGFPHEIKGTGIYAFVVPKAEGEEAGQSTKGPETCG